MARKKLSSGGFSNKQPVREKICKEYDHEFANEPLTTNAIYNNNNNKPKKR